MRAVLRLLLRRHRLFLSAWLAGILALVAVTLPSYRETYGADIAGSGVPDMLRATPGLTLLYGRLPSPGTLGQLFVWESGTYALVLAGVMAVLLAVAITRAEEDAGTTELVRAAGVHPRTPLLAAAAVLGLACGLLGAGSAAVLALTALAYEELTGTGAAAFGLVAFLVPLALGMLTMIGAQLRDSARAARGMAFALLAGAFALRVLADDREWRWLHWLTPLGWREVIAPYSDDRMWAAVPLALVCGALLAVCVLLDRGREPGAARWVRTRTRQRRLRISGPLGWALRDAHGAVIGWTAAVWGSAVLFGSMADGLITTIREDPTTAALLAQMGAGGLDPGAMFFDFLGGLLALLVLIAATALTLRWHGEERAGRLVNELATGVPRWRSLLARSLVAGAFAAVVSTGAGLAMGAVGAWQLDDPAALGQGVGAVAGHLPGILAGVGIATLVMALAPRLTGAVWAVPSASGLLFFFGELLSVPEAVIDAGLLAHTPVPRADGWPDWGEWASGAPALLMTAALLGTATGAALVGRRDLQPG